MEAGMDEHVTAAPVYDRAAALEHVGDDLTVLRAIVEMFLEQGPERLGAIADAVGAGSTSELESAAHALKGSAATLGLERVRVLALALEDLGLAGSQKGAADRLAELRRAMDEGLNALREELGNAVGDTP
jgi:HPt (histidine-containing phosphotransfer) domain-containing protein